MNEADYEIIRAWVQEEYNTLDCVMRLIDILYGRVHGDDPDSYFDNLATALDLVFEQRFGWPAGQAMNMPVVHALIALDHAMNYDAPGKPSVWAITA